MLEAVQVYRYLAPRKTSVSNKVVKQHAHTQKQIEIQAAYIPSISAKKKPKYCFFDSWITLGVLSILHTNMRHVLIELHSIMTTCQYQQFNQTAPQKGSGQHHKSKDRYFLPKNHSYLGPSGWRRARPPCGMNFNGPTWRRYTSVTLVSDDSISVFGSWSQN